MGIFDQCLFGNPGNTEGCWGLWNTGSRKEKIRIRCLKTLKLGIVLQLQNLLEVGNVWEKYGILSTHVYEICNLISKMLNEFM